MLLLLNSKGLEQLWHKIYRIILLLILFGFFCSCGNSKSERSNKDFLKQYGTDIQKINTRREEMGMVRTENKVDMNWKSPKDIFKIDNVESSKSAYIDTSQIVMPKSPETFLPDATTFIKGQGTMQLPNDMFNVSYNLENFPNSYGRPSLSFDDIDIPNQDAFGIETKLGEKNYQLIGHKALQRDIDLSKKLSSKEDQQLSIELIQEQKQAKRKKYISEKSITKTDDKKDG